MIRGKIPQLGELTADVWVSERHRREVEATQNPIEYGSPITDHAFVKARTLSVRFGVTNTPFTDNRSFSGDDRVDDARNKLFAIQDNAALLTVSTISGGYYENCLLVGIGWETDSKNPHATIFDLELEEIIITSTEKIEYQPLSADERTDGKASTTQKRGEANTKSRDEADEARRNHTADANSDAEAAAKAAAAKAQADKLAGSYDKTFLKKIMDFL